MDDARCASYHIKQTATDIEALVKRKNIPIEKKSLSFV